MEIFTNMIFWIIVVVIIVLLAIIGYVAEGTVLANKKNEKNKNENKKEEEALSAWESDAPVNDEKHETVYNTADQSWMDMPDVTSTSDSKINLEQPKEEASSSFSEADNQSLSLDSVNQSENKTDDVFLSSNTNEVLGQTNNSNLEPATNEKQNSIDNSTVPEPKENKPTPTVSEMSNPVNSEEKNKDTDTLDIWAK